MGGWGYSFPLSKDVLAFRSLGDFNNKKNIKLSLTVSVKAK